MCKKRPFYKVFFLFLFFLTFLGCNFSPSSYCVGVDPNWTSSQYGKKKANVFGFTQDFLLMLSKKTKASFEKIIINEKVLFNKLNEGECDAIITTVNPNEINENYYQFSELFLATGPVIVVNQNSLIAKQEDLVNKKVAIQEEDVIFLNLAKFPKTIFTIYTSKDQAVVDLEAGRLDAAFLRKIDAETFLNDTYYRKMKIIGSPLNERGVRFVTKKNSNFILMRDLNKQLQFLKKKSQYTKLLQKWNLSLN